MEEIKSKIRTLTPEMTDELLDLMYEYTVMRLRMEYSPERMISQLKEDNDFESKIYEIAFSRQEV